MNKWTIVVLAFCLLSFKKDKSTFKGEQTYIPVDNTFSNWMDIQFVNDLRGPDSKHHPQLSKVYGVFYTGKPSTALEKENFVYINPYEYRTETDMAGILSENARPWPAAARYAIKDTRAWVNLQNDYKYIVARTSSEATQIYKPFYAMRAEVTNGEYWKFVEAVRDSVMRELLAKHLPERYSKEEGLLNYSLEIIPWDTTIVNALDEGGYYYPQARTFYRRREIDARNIVYYDPEAGVDEPIAIYPDTTSWVRHFALDDSEVMENLYFWHPAFDSYPVVGVNYHQAQAYCKWKQQQINKTYETEDVVYAVQLPNAVQWEWMSARSNGLYKLGLVDHTYLMDLILDYDSYTTANGKGETFNSHSYIGKTNRVQNEHLAKSVKEEWFMYQYHTYSVRPPSRKELKLPEDRVLAAIVKDRNRSLVGLGGNVSEWIDNSYADWQNVFNLRMQLLEEAETSDATVQASLEQFWNERIDKNGQLVVGANWWDERYGERYGANAAGILPKTFLDPNEARCTVGFRCVVVPHIKTVKEEG